LSFNRDELDAIEAWIVTAKPLSGICYRSVEYRYMDPMAESDSAVSEEVLARKQRLGGSAQITLDKYPRIVFGVAVSLDRGLDLSKRGLPKAMASVRQSCLAPDDLIPSMELGDLLRARAIQGLVFPSAVGRGKNLIVYLEQCPGAALEIHNAVGLMKKMRQILRKPK
jgi:RES domain